MTAPEPPNMHADGGHFASPWMMMVKHFGKTQARILLKKLEALPVPANNRAKVKAARKQRRKQ